MNFNELKQKAKAKKIEYTTRAKVFYYQHEAEIWMVATVAVPAVAAIAKSASKSYTAHKEEQHRLMQKYDPATGLYVNLRHPLTAIETERMLQMQRELGITQTECLIRLGLIK